GLLTKRINGFSQTREFYSPEYTPENIGSEKPDHRTTLYWNPEIVFKNNSDTISFFTCDNLARYKIFVEGISETGKIILGEAGFEVNTFYQGIFESE
ncbi:MAG: hypothetical protein JW833_09245, partial [Prolixibacteraceae bacterium]|nr:hypothetical protein [Prolixibacteraceae bacterium]